MKLKTLGVLALAGAFVLSGCSADPSPTADYTGKAVIQKAERPTRKGGCIVTVKTYSGLTGQVRVGRRTTCDGWNAGNVVFLQDGKLLK